PRFSSAATSRNAVDLCTPSSLAISVTPASPSRARISSTVTARSTDCTGDASLPLLLIEQQYGGQAGFRPSGSRRRRRSSGRAMNRICREDPRTGCFKINFPLVLREPDVLVVDAGNVLTDVIGHDRCPAPGCWLRFRR